VSIAAVAHRGIVVCCGAGGVGKTTVSAALGLALARRGGRVAVVTIDPARRLAAALGLEELGDEPRRVEGADPAGAGELWALQLDAKATFDRLVTRHAPDPAAAERILGNRIYGHLSGAVAGSQEFMAVERLNELTLDGRFDRIVLDTPPAQNALDFLDAPERIIRFLEGRALRMLLAPSGHGAGRLGWRVLHAGSSTVLSVLERITGAQLLRDVSDFLAGFEGMYAGFAERARAVRERLHSPESGFVVVSAPDDEPVREAVALVGRLQDDGYPIAMAVMNRVRAAPPGDPPAASLARALGAAGAADADDLAARVLAQLGEERVRASRDARALERLGGLLAGRPLARIPELDEEPVELEGLARVAAALSP
jgi:anion-transporting  ArsA/GET3 family ATPase